MKLGFLFPADRQMVSRLARVALPFALIALLTVTGGTAHAQSKIYTWTDAEGNVHYGDRPPRDVVSEEINIRGQRQAAIDINPSQLNGTWFGRSPDGTETRMRIQENGSIRFSQTRPNQTVYNYQGIWRLEDRTLSVITEFIEEGGGGTRLRRSVEPVQLDYNFTSFSPENFTARIQGEEIRVSLVD